MRSLVSSALRALVVAAALVPLAGCLSNRPDFMRDGNPAPPLAGTTVAGERVDLARERGKVAVVVFFMDGCGQCRSLYPMQRELAARMKDKPFLLVGVDGKDSAPALRDAAQRERMSWPVVADEDASIATAWGVGSVPLLYVIDADGVIRGCDLSQRSLFATVDELIAERAKSSAP